MATIPSVDDLPCAVVTASSDGKIEMVNATLADWIGLPKDKLIGARLCDVLDETASPAELRRESGETLSVTVAAHEAKGPNGRRILVLMPRDVPPVTALRPSTQPTYEDTRRALEDANALLDTIFETAPIGLGVWDHDLRFVRVNKRLAEINGVLPEEHIGRQPHEILPEIVNIDDIYARWREILETGESWNIEVRGVTPAAPGLVRTWDENFYPIKAQGRVVGIGAVVEETTERKRNLEHIKMLVKELNHRCKNLLSIVLAIARQTSRGGDPAEFIGRFTNRIQGLVASHDLLVRDDWTGVAIGDLVRGQLAPFEELIGKRVHIAGPLVRLRPAAAQGLGMAIHELATNAAKYGALSTATGEVEIVWDVVMSDGETGRREERLLARWEERGGPAVTPPVREGFGQLVIGKLLEAAVTGNASVAFKPEGIVWMLSAPTLGNIEDLSGSS